MILLVMIKNLINVFLSCEYCVTGREAIASALVFFIFIAYLIARHLF